jgi:hypothetical protein
LVAGAFTGGLTGIAGAAVGLEPLLSPPSEGGLALVAGLAVSAGRLGVAGAVALVLALAPVSAPAEGSGAVLVEALEEALGEAVAPADQSLLIRALGEAFR